MKRAIYPGTFDPVTNGHLDVLERALNVFDEIIVGVAENPIKKSLFSLEERIEMVKEAAKKFKKVKVKGFDTLLVDFAKKEKAKVLIRGLRAMSDFEQEFQQATINRMLNTEIESMFVMTSEKYFFLSSSMAKEIAGLGGNLKALVPKNVEQNLKKKLKK